MGTLAVTLQMQLRQGLCMCRVHVCGGIMVSQRGSQSKTADANGLPRKRQDGDQD